MNGEQKEPRDPSDATIVRIDERTKALIEEVRDVKRTIVTKTEFAPVKALVYGLVGLILAGVITALLAQIIAK